MAASPDPYRGSPPTPSPIVIKGGAFPRRLAAGLGSVFVLFTVLLVHRVELTCERAPTPTGGVCEAHSERMGWTHDAVRVDLASVQGAEVDSDDGASKVVLTTRQGTLALTHGAESGRADEKAAMVAAVNRFLADPGQQKLVTAYGSGWGPDPLVLLLLAFVLALPLAASRSGRVVVDRAGGVVRVVRPRFPLGTVEETVDLARVSRAIVEESQGEDGTEYRVALVLDHGEVVPMTHRFEGDRAQKERVVARIDQALARLD